MIITRVTDWIGCTPLLELRIRNSDWRLFLKLEKFNPGGSMKDRMARGMIDAAERSGRLKPGGTIVESSSGNTGTGLAMVAAERGYRFIVVVDHQTAKDKIRTMKALGATAVVIGADRPGDRVATADREALAREIAETTPGAVLMAQHENPANAASYDGLARDLVEVLGSFDLLIGSVGTGGSLCGTARGVKAQCPRTRVIGVEPKGSVIFGAQGGTYYQSGTGVPPDVALGSVIDYPLIDEGCTVGDAAAFNACRFMAHRFGLLLGGSAGGVIYAAAERLRTLPGSGTMVALVGDGGEKYLDTIYDDDWMTERRLLDRSVETDLAMVLTSIDASEDIHAAA
ncbi:PLP-dependent cysteine synthase family protein [Microvirga pudoricolor]|uniref:PLP-dependent cysteine synthase family protein n=1 Tax=Microvirga pudoricolor TaxID=2778729 RepID=UPI0019506568|nr:cysteine synthase family protein [Microvirga pudoricolor]MBM6593662.1 cysteine synthase family protein [Microvirga pudoricolor]